MCVSVCPVHDSLTSGSHVNRDDRVVVAAEIMASAISYQVPVHVGGVRVCGQKQKYQLYPVWNARVRGAGREIWACNGNSNKRYASTLHTHGTHTHRNTHSLSTTGLPDTWRNFGCLWLVGFRVNCLPNVNSQLTNQSWFSVCVSVCVCEPPSSLESAQCWLLTVFNSIYHIPYWWHWQTHTTGQVAGTKSRLKILLLSLVLVLNATLALGKHFELLAKVKAETK